MRSEATHRGWGTGSQVPRQLNQYNPPVHANRALSAAHIPRFSSPYTIKFTDFPLLSVFVHQVMK